MAVQANLTSLDPYDANDTVSLAAAKAFYQGLYGFDKDMKLVKVLAKAELSRLDTDGETWSPLAHKTTEVSALVEDLLGFKAEQFRQVVLLPQGQFRKLLAASSAERERILETLFGTAAYKRVQDALTVPYPHLTPPTICSVWISVGARSLYTKHYT